MTKLRRVYVVHGSYMLTLPKKWVRRWEMEHRQQLQDVSVEAGDDGSLTYRPLTREQADELAASLLKMII